jgi:hypothetical protein
VDLESITAKIRPRRGWEAIDLGVTLVQTHAATLYKIWFAVSLPIFLLLMLMPYLSSVMMIFVFWWLKPIMERPLLHFLSRELFGESLTVKQCAKAFYSVAKLQWFASLTWRRFSFTRSFDCPLIQLEKLKSAERAKRLRVIHSSTFGTSGSGNAVWLTIIFFIIEIIIYLSIIVLMYLFIPDVYADELDLFKWISSEKQSSSIEVIFNLFTYLAMSLVAPFYVACGFALYLNQRTHLEAWDIELEFKRLAEKMDKKSSNIKVRLASYASIGLLLILTSSFNSSPVYAEEITKEEPTIEISNSEELNHAEAKKMIKAIKDGKDFHQIEIEETNRYIKSKTEEKDKDLDSNISPLWFAFAKIFAVIVEFALWVFITVLVIFLVIKYKHLLVRSMPNKKIKRKRPQQLFGLDLKSNSLPDKPWLVAEQLVNEQRYREALSLLYRASLIWSIDHTNALIKEGYTELECYEQISKYVNKNVQRYLKLLTHHWRGLAYAHNTPEKKLLLSLCEDWPKNLIIADKSLENKAINLEN